MPAWMRLTIRLTRNPSGDAWPYTGQCVEIPGAISEGRTQKETVENVVAAVRDIVEARRRKARTASRGRARFRTVVVDA